MRIAIIPARGGSKRIARKNIKHFFGKPIISYAIRTALDSGLFEHVIVSTEDREIAKIALNYGAEVPFFRPHKLADDYASTLAVISHAVEECEKLGWLIEEACCIYPASPFINVDDLKKAYQKLIDNNAYYSFPIVEFPSPIQRSLKKKNNGFVSLMFDKYLFTRTQDIEVTYWDAGQFYWGKYKAWVKKIHMYTKAIGYVVSDSRIIDIDTPSDWEKAEEIYKKIRNKERL